MMILVGKIGKTNGVQGLVRLKSFTVDQDGIEKFQKFFFEDGKEIKIQFKQKLEKYYICKINCVNNLEAAKQIINKYIYILSDQLPKLTDGNFYYKDLVGMTVTVDQRKIGKVIKVENHGAGDYFEVLKSNKDSILVPFIKTHVIKTDLKNKTIHLDSKYFSNEI